MTNKDGSFVVIFKNDLKKEVFLVFRSDMSIWNLTGGGIEDGETPEEAVIRETFEETGFKIEILHKLGIYNNIDVKTGGVWNQTHLFEGRVVFGKFIPEFDGCKGEWFSVSKLPADIKPVTKTRIDDALTFGGKTFIKDFRPLG
jgi:8-oxo-dGTP pyrophosphatase MutT (NUDIX family)